MTSLRRDQIALIIQFLQEEKLNDTMHKLEQESGLFFNLKYFEEKVLDGDWNEVENYLSSFTKVDENKYSTEIFFEIRKQKYLEALDRSNKGEAVEILFKELKEFSKLNQDIYNELTTLLTLKNFRENEELSNCGDTKSLRNLLMLELKRLIGVNPLFRDKLNFPSFKASRLQTLINQSLNWQHHLCKNPKANPDIKTLFTDHTCSPSNEFATPTPINLLPVDIERRSSHTPQRAHAGLLTPDTAISNVNALIGSIENASASATAQSPIATTSLLPDPSRQGTPQQASLPHDDLPTNVVCTLYPTSTVASIDFHPSLHSLLAVGCENGEISLWEAGTRERLIFKPFKIWNISACSYLFQARTGKNSSISINRVSWSPKGDFIGVAFAKHLIHLYAYKAPQDLHQHLEIDAHVGSVNDLAFSYQNKKPCIVTCGDDKSIKVWDLNGQTLFKIEGHRAPIYSICPHQKGNVQFIISNDFEGQINKWVYGNMHYVGDYDTSGQWCAKMLYSANGSRLFSCGTNKEGDFSLYEWNESKGAIKRIYSGFSNKSTGVVHFDTSKSRFLAAGEDNQIKFWEMDKRNVITTTYAEGGLPCLPLLKFNKEGSLLAVTTEDNGLKILAGTDGLKYSRAIGAQLCEASRAPAVIELSHFCYASKNGVDSIARITEKKITLDDEAKAWELKEIVSPVQCRTLTMPQEKMTPTSKVACLYTKSGTGLLALGTNGIHKMWKWSINELNPSGKATTSVVPQNWQPHTGTLMTNDVPENFEAVVPCVILTNNDFYIISACGGKVSLFNILKFKVLATIMPPPPTSTSLAFHPKDNNIVAIGKDNSEILIYNFQRQKIMHILKGHRKHITGLAFSSQLNILVSSDADAQLLFWSIDSWEEKKSLLIKMPARNTFVGDTRVQFHTNQVTLLVCHSTNLAICDVSKMEMICQWILQDGLSGSITSATFSCNGQLVYATFTDGNIGVFDSDTLKLRCRIASSAYLHQILSNSQNVYPLVIAAHPHEPNQFAIGLSDGSVNVIEPLESEGWWGNIVVIDNDMQIDGTTLHSINK